MAKIWLPHHKFWSPSYFIREIVFLLSHRNTSGSLGEREILWELELQVSLSTASQSSNKLSQKFNL